MKVLILNTAVPFVRGGAEELADHLLAALNRTAGVEAELVKVPFHWIPAERLLDEVLINQNIRICNADRVIALKFPAYLIPHPDKTFWILHQFRQAYDLAEVGQGLSDSGREGEIKRAIRAADMQAFEGARAIYVNSPVTAARLSRFNGVASEVLYPPLNTPELFGPEGPGWSQEGAYLFAGGRINRAKRQDLMVEALARLPRTSPARLVIAGPPDTPEDGERLQGLIARLGLEDRVELRLGFRPREEIATLVNGALACLALPYDEDSLSYVAMEAAAAGKAVITASDCGGVLELVTPLTGRVAAPDAASLAEEIQRLVQSPHRAREMGAAAAETFRRRGLTWEATVERLLS